MSESGADGTAVDLTAQPRLQHHHHNEIFGALYAWRKAHEQIIDLSGDAGQAGLLGFDQMGHFGPNGCDVVADEIRALGYTRLRLAELGAGFGGALRHLADRLTRHGVEVSQAVGVELVEGHCALAVAIGRSIGSVTRMVCSDVANLPLRDGALDVVVSTGAMPHFPRSGAALAQAARVLRPGGHLVLTEEVSLVRDADVVLPAEFRRLHPEGVFFLTARQERDRQLAAAGLTEVRHRSLLPWAADLMTDRIRALKLFQGTAHNIFGVHETQLMRDSLAVARELYLAGVLIPRLTTARRPR